MWSPLAHTPEEGWRHPLYPPEPDTKEAELGPAPVLSPRDYIILGKVFEGKKPRLIAEELGVARHVIYTRVNRPAFQQQIRLTEQSIMERIARGEFGAMAIAKANVIGAMRRLVAQAKQSPDERVKLQANLKLLEYGGIQVPKPAVLESPERLIDLMNGEEAEHFAQTGVFPDRFRDQIARLATSVLKEQEQRRWRPRLESTLPGETLESEPERTAAVEEAEPE